MKIHLLGPGLLVVTTLFLTAGCELGGSDLDDDGQPVDTSASTPAPASTETATTTVQPETVVVENSAGDELDISGARMLGPHKDMVAQNARITRGMYAADKEGNLVQMAFEDLNWPSEGSGKKLDGGVYIFWDDGGGIVGGLFDWHAVGQTAKTLENIHDGYLDGRQPPRGAAIWFAIVSMDASERTNVKRSDSAW